MPKDILLSPTRELLIEFWRMLSGLLAAVIFFIIGWIVSKVLKILAGKFFKTIKIDLLVEESGLKEILTRGQISKDPSELLAGIIYWLLIIAVLSIALNVAKIPIPQTVVETLLAFIPKIIIGLIIFILSLFVGNIFEGIVNTAAGNAGIEKPYVLGKITRIAIVVFGTVLTLQEIGIGGNFVTSSFNIVLASASFAFALAFGLGAKDTVKEWLDGTFKKKQ